MLTDQEAKDLAQRILAVLRGRCDVEALQALMSAGEAVTRKMGMRGKYGGSSRNPHDEVRPAWMRRNRRYKVEEDPEVHAFFWDQIFEKGVNPTEASRRAKRRFAPDLAPGNSSVHRWALAMRKEMAE